MGKIAQLDIDRWIDQLHVFNPVDCANYVLPGRWGQRKECCMEDEEKI